MMSAYQVLAKKEQASEVAAVLSIEVMLLNQATERAATAKFAAAFITYQDTYYSLIFKVCDQF